MLLLLMPFLCGCRGKGNMQTVGQSDTLALKYATRLSIMEGKGFTMVKLADPWNTGHTLHTYVLVPDSAELPSELPKGTLIRTPLKRSVVATSVHCSLLLSLHRLNAIAGVCDRQYIHLPQVQELCEKGTIVDCGSSLSPTIETIIDLHPDAIFLSPFQNSGGYGRLEELNVPIVETADYMETSALGRAEWMRFYGLLFGAKIEADSLFEEVERNYQELSRLAKTDQQRKSLMMDKQTGSVWYVPGGKSTMGRLMADANADYIWADDDHSGSVALPFESVLERAGEADAWLFRYNGSQPMTYATLLSEHAGYKQFKAFREQAAYGCNTENSGFYEETPFHPDLLLRDFIIIAHPALQIGEPRYFHKVKSEK